MNKFTTLVTEKLTRRKTNKKAGKALLVMCLFLGGINLNAQQESVGFTQADRDRIIQTQTELAGLRAEMNARFESVDKRFEAVDKRFEDLRSDVNKRFEQVNTYIGWMIALFAAITASTIGFAIWDRRTMIRPFETKVLQMDAAILELKSETKASKIMIALRELAKTDSKLAEILKNNNLL